LIVHLGQLLLDRSQFNGLGPVDQSLLRQSVLCFEFVLALSSWSSFFPALCWQCV